MEFTIYPVYLFIYNPDMSVQECLKRVSLQLDSAAALCGRAVVSLVRDGPARFVRLTFARAYVYVTLLTRRSPTQPRLVAVSKTKPAAAVLDAYAAGQRHFGENYVQELIDKAPRLPLDIRWHFIGQLQSNKAKALVASVPNLWAVESVDGVKLAGLLQKAAAAAGRASPLHVFVQVNTSAEAQKGGVAPGAPAVELARYIVDACPALRLVGLMTIGKLGSVAQEYFDRLADERGRVLAAFCEAGISAERFGPLPGDGADCVPSHGVPNASESGGAGGSTGDGGGAGRLELSMGMSGDYELAVRCGSTNVRIGSSIFGAREYADSRAAAALSAAAEAEAAAAAIAAAHAAADVPTTTSAVTGTA